MALPSLVLPRQCPDPYRPVVPRQPKNFRIDSVSIEHLEPEGYLSTGPDTAVPFRFEAHFLLGIPEATVAIEVFVGADLRPVVIDLSIRSKVRTPITTSVLRQVLVDQLLHAALNEATVPASVREEWLASLPPQFRPQTSPAGTPREPTPSPEQRTRRHSEDDARLAAQIYSEAVAAGSRAPAVAVANALNRSRAQAARYIRRARELGLLSPLDLPEKT
jgi:hypothetical protein